MNEGETCPSTADGHGCELVAGHYPNVLHGADFGGNDGFVTWSEEGEDLCQ